MTPYVKTENGNTFYYKDKEFKLLHHRVDGPAIEWADGGKEWYLNGELHREDGPAIEWANGDKVWYLNGKKHREDGPAVEWADGYKAWYLNGTEYPEAEFNKKMNSTIEITMAELEKLLGKKVKIVN